MKKKNKFVFFGSPRFAETFLLEILKMGYVPDVIVCNPDRPVGRKKIITPPPTKIIAEKNKISVLQPEKLSKENAPNADFAVVAAYSKIIPQSVIDKFTHGVIGIHPSVLPLFRGTTPIQSVLLSGNTETGTSVFLIDKEVDHGPIIASEKIKIHENDTYASLEEKLAILGAKIFVETIEKYLGGTLTPTPQNHENATFTKKFTREDAFIPLEILESAKNGLNSFLVSRKIKALSTEPGAWTIKNGKQTKLLDCIIYENKLVITKIQIEGKKPQILK